jgi:cytochrome bd-type quinol oxidase subunit 1
MSLVLARWQFAFTSVNHFLFIPITIGLAFLTALLQTAWHRSGREEYLRLTMAHLGVVVLPPAGAPGARPPGLLARKKGARHGRNL